MNTEYIMFLIMALANILATVVLVFALFSHESINISKVYKVAFMFGAFGLAWQAFRNVYFLVTGHSMLDTDVPLWYLKDLGWVTIAGYFVYLFWNKELTFH
jgi:hypothetical protein